MVDAQRRVRRGSAAVFLGPRPAAPIAFPSAAFHEITLDYDGTTARLRADGAVAAELAGNVPGKVASFSIYLGFYADAASTPWSVRYDDVRCTTTP